jgi:hypothetical protein
MNAVPETTRRHPRTTREAWREWPENCLGIAEPVDPEAARRARNAEIAAFVEHVVLPAVCAFALGVLVALS